MIVAGEACALAFPRVLLVHTAAHPEADLLDCAAMLSGGETEIAAYPSGAVLRSLSPAVRYRFEARGLAPPRVRLLAELDVDAAFEAASAARADLLVMRHPRAFDRPRALARRLLVESPCSICLVPEGAPARIDCILTGISLDESGRHLLDRAASLYRSTRAQELIALYSCFHDSVCSDEDQHQEFVSERTLALLRFMTKARPAGVSCTPLIEEAAEPHRALARVAAERSADLVVVGRRRGAAPRVSASLLWDCPAPLVQVLLPGPARGIRTVLRRVFSNPEPKFN
jgi:nucleotide-binding universal stress UspA family protein